jgi:hypothetical protein
MISMTVPGMISELLPVGLIPMIQRFACSSLGIFSGRYMKMSPVISPDFYYLMNSAVLLIPELERIFLDLQPLETAWKNRIYGSCPGSEFQPDL